MLIENQSMRKELSQLQASRSSNGIRAEDSINMSKFSFGPNEENILRELDILKNENNVLKERLRQTGGDFNQNQIEDLRAGIDLSFAQSRIDKLKDQNAYLQQNLDELRSVEEENKYLSSKLMEFEEKENKSTQENHNEITRLQNQLAQSETARIKLQNQAMDQNKMINHLNAKLSALQQKIQMMNDHYITLSQFEPNASRGANSQENSIKNSDNYRMPDQVQNQPQKELTEEIQIRISNKSQTSIPVPHIPVTNVNKRYVGDDQKKPLQIQNIEAVSTVRPPTTSPKPILRSSSFKKQVSFSNDVKSESDDQLKQNQPSRKQNSSSRFLNEQNNSSEANIKPEKPQKPDPNVQRVLYQLPDGRTVSKEDYEDYKREKVEMSKKLLNQSKSNDTLTSSISHKNNNDNYPEPGRRDSRKSGYEDAEVEEDSRKEHKEKKHSKHRKEKSSKRHHHRDRDRQHHEDDEGVIRIESRKGKSSRDQDEEDGKDRRERSSRRRKDTESRHSQQADQIDQDYEIENGRRVKVHYPSIDYHPLTKDATQTTPGIQQPSNHSNNQNNYKISAKDYQEEIPQQKNIQPPNGLPIWPNPESPLYGMVKPPDPNRALKAHLGIKEPEREQAPKFDPKNMVSDLDIKSIVERGFNKILEQHNLSNFQSSSSLKDFKMPLSSSSSHFQQSNSSSFGLPVSQLSSKGFDYDTSKTASSGSGYMYDTRSMMGSEHPQNYEAFRNKGASQFEQNPISSNSDWKKPSSGIDNMKLIQGYQTNYSSTNYNNYRSKYFDHN